MGGRGRVVVMIFLFAANPSVLRGTSHYGQRSRGRQFPPIKLQETKSSASWPFTLWPKSKGRHNLKWLFLEEGDGLSKEVWVGRGWKPKLWSRGRRSISMKKSIIDKILAVRWEGLFSAKIKVGCCFGFGLWDWPLEAYGQRFGLWAWPLETSH
jgi:hypothetical protein